MFNLLENLPKEEKDFLRSQIKLNIIQGTREELEYFKKSMYPTKISDYNKKLSVLKRDLNLLESDLNSVRIPVHPSKLKYIVRVQLEAIGACREEILSTLMEIFNENISKLPTTQNNLEQFPNQKASSALDDLARYL